MAANGEPLIVYAGANAPHPRAEDEDVADPLTPAEDQAFPAMSAPTVSSGAAVGEGGVCVQLVHRALAES